MKLFCKYLDDDKLYEFLIIKNWCTLSFEQHIQERIYLNRINKVIEPKYVECWVFEL